MRYLPFGTTLGLLSSLALTGGLAPAQAATLAAGNKHTCAIISDGHVKCWGNNSYGQLGDGTRTSRNAPVRVKKVNGAFAIVAGGDHTCAIVGHFGAVKCWGRNSSGQLGDATRTDRLISTYVRILRDVIAIAAGDEHTCALIRGRRVKCWGDNTQGQLGIGTGDSSKTLPHSVKKLSGAADIAAGGLHTCAFLRFSDSVKCWGYNFYGQLGDGSKTTHFTPVRVNELSGVNAITAGAFHSCAATSTGVKCWGHNQFGQLGNKMDRDSTTPVRVKKLGQGVNAITAGGAHTCAKVFGRSSAKCWGRNQSGQLGDGTFTGRWSRIGWRRSPMPNTPASSLRVARTPVPLSAVASCVGAGTIMANSATGQTRPGPIRLS